MAFPWTESTRRVVLKILSSRSKMVILTRGVLIDIARHERRGLSRARHADLSRGLGAMGEANRRKSFRR